MTVQKYFAPNLKYCARAEAHQFKWFAWLLRTRNQRCNYLKICYHKKKSVILLVCYNFRACQDKAPRKWFTAQQLSILTCLLLFHWDTLATWAPNVFRVRSFVKANGHAPVGKKQNWQHSPLFIFQDFCPELAVSKEDITSWGASAFVVKSRMYAQRFPS